ncbi:hypothetical protein QIA34_05330 (plasmid) [Borreliella yangtzensis]|uniref:Vacuolar-type H+-ATPase subunit I/STV1 n=1 Tax=Borreliella yangtzensis TaxID=683292 RepID=A0ABR6PBF3_9SPIR|nr:vacuolar-type H+-ATPase subunit I/STV1 [Borreliella yangtzensis]
MKKKIFIICVIFVLIISCKNYADLKQGVEDSVKNTEQQIKGFLETKKEELTEGLKNLESEVSLKVKGLMQADAPQEQLQKQEEKKEQENRKKALEDAKEKVEGFKKELEELEKRIEEKNKNSDEDTYDPADDPMRIGNEACKCALELGFNLDDLLSKMYVVYNGERYFVYKGIETDKGIVTNLFQKIEEELKNNN